MSLRVNTNIAAMNAYRNLTATDSMMSKSLEKLSSGYRINRAADDAAGLSISENLRSQVGGLKVAVRNAQDGISVVQTAEGALTETHAILQRMRDLAVQASNTGSQDSTARTAADTEVTQLTAELDRIATSTKFGNQVLLAGSFSGAFQVGANAGELITISVSTPMTASGLGVNGVSLLNSASSALANIDSAISAVSTARANLGAYQNRFEHTINNLNVAVENLSASESRIRDTDMAQEMVSFTRSQILTQAGTSMLSQANQSSQGVLSLLK
ncbi:flagellin [Motilibacter rhizosphaerae]|uniref:Flagellin n=1 Tax=Motilibacter rhizosphaerae TaxID=598652 RepID=A0A4Q7NW27_9ACTN|nr:flagellin [Motilibacter rhizosphaerae]RZS91405.1 flagellin [Motilibacter rhizosphaerae]